MQLGNWIEKSGMDDAAGSRRVAFDSEVFHEEFHSFMVIDLMHFAGSLVVEHLVSVPLATERGHHHPDPSGVQSLLCQRPSHDLGWSCSLNVSGEKPLFFELFQSSGQNFRGNALEGLEEHVETVYIVETDISDDRHRPFLAEYIERGLDGTISKFYFDESGLEGTVSHSKTGLLR